MARILYLGNSDKSSTSLQRANALKRIGHTVDVCDPYQLLNKEPGWLQAIHFRTGYVLFQKKISRWIKAVTSNAVAPDLVWVDSGELFGKKILPVLKKFNCPVVLYNVDDPTGRRDGYRFYSLLKAIRQYNLVAVVRKESEDECRQLGVQQVMRVFRSYDEVAHRPFDNIADIPAAFRSGAAFIGTWMRHEKRDEFFLALIKEGIPLSIWGNRWEKSPHWEQLKDCYRGKALSGRDYVAAIQGSKICLGLLSKGNRDLHTQRSLEVPYAGGLFCAERTTEHLELYAEGKEAVFWSDAAECARVCKELLANDTEREAIRVAGMQRIRTLHLGNEDICKKIVNTLLQSSSAETII